MKGQTPNRRIAADNSMHDVSNKQSQELAKQNQIQTNQGYTEFFSWGNDEMGQLGHGQESQDRKKIFNLPKSLSFEVLIAQVSCGQSHTSFISNQGYVFSFGCNTDGQLGVNDSAIKFSTAPLLVSDLVSLQITPASISCGGYHTAVLSNTGDVYFWGRNLQGQCGRSINYNQFLFSPHKLHLETTNKSFRAIECGDQHSAVITKTGELYTFGDNSEGQLGIGIEFKNNVDRPAIVSSISEEVIQVSCGFRHTLVLTNHGTVLGMGTNKKYELASGTLQKSSQPIRIQTIDMFAVEKVFAGGFSVAITSHNELLIWGSGDFGVFQSPQKIFLEDIKFIDVNLSMSNDSFGAALDDQGFVYTWGANQYGQLGQGDFRLRKLPTKVAQLRKKKVRQIACGAGFVVALGKDVPEGTQKSKTKKQKTEKEPEQLSSRSRSQVTFGANSIAQQSVQRRKNNDLDRSHLTTLNENNHRSQVRPPEKTQHHSQEGRPSPLRMKNAQQIQQTPNVRQQNDNYQNQINDLSVERKRRIQAEKELREREYELINQKQQANQLQDQQSQILMYQRDNEVLRDALQKEQENSYRLLSDVHKTLSDMKIVKDALDAKTREAHQFQLENRRQSELTKELEVENEKLKQDQSQLYQRNSEETHKLKNHINECENIINQQRDHIQDLERQLITKIDIQKQVDNESEQVRKENQDSRLQVFALNERIKTLEYQVDSTQKENDDLKYDNTLLYEKNVQKDDKLIQLSDELSKIKDIFEMENKKRQQLEQDNKFSLSRQNDLENQLYNEKQASIARQKQNDELIKEQERQKRDLEDQIAIKNIDQDNLKRACDELHYELENQRKIVNAKQDEIGSLTKIIQQQSLNNNELVSTIKDLENQIKDVEDKNRRLVELLNANIYNRAEQYKERVLNKLQERTPGSNITPNKTAPSLNNPNLTINSEFNPSGIQTKVQPSPIRLQKLLNDDKESILKDRERLLKMAEDLTKQQDLSKSQGPSQSVLNDYNQFRQNLPQFVSPFSNQNESTLSPSKSVHFADQQQQPQYNDLNNRLRMSDLSGGFVNMATPYQQNINNISRPNETSPERIAEILKQQSPL